MAEVVLANGGGLCSGVFRPQLCGQLAGCPSMAALLPKLGIDGLIVGRLAPGPAGVAGR
jgi:hypothetical protein